MHEKLESGSEEWIDPDDAPELDDAFFDRALVHDNGQLVGAQPRRRLGRAPPPAGSQADVVLRLDLDVIAYFKAEGQGWQTRMNAALRAAMEKSAAA